MTIDYQLETADLRAFSEARRSFIPRKPYYWYFGVVLPSLCAGLAIVIGSFPIAAGFTVLFAVVSSGTQTYLSRRYYADAYAENNCPIAKLPSRLTVSEDELVITTEAYTLSYRWRFIREVFQLGNYVYFVLSPLERVHLPVRAFADEEQLRRFIAVTQSYAKKST
jgi:hypothetical protein